MHKLKIPPGIVMSWMPSCRVAVSCFFLLTGLCSLQPTKLQASENDALEDWFKVEIAVFAQISPVFENELWPMPDVTYPADVLSILPQGKRFPEPARLWHLEDMQQYNSLNLRKRSLGSSRRNAWRRIMNSISEAETNTPPAFTALRETDLTLNSTVRSLKRSSRYRLIHYTGWLQPIISNDSSTSILLQAGAHYGDYFEVDGSLTLSRSRFNHVEADLWFTVFTEYDLNQSRRNIYELSQNELLAAHPKIRQWELNRNRYIPVQTHRLKERRRLKNGELNYLDHPAFGLFIKIEKYGVDTDTSN